MRATLKHGRQRGCPHRRHHSRPPWRSRPRRRLRLMSLPRESLETWRHGYEVAEFCVVSARRPHRWATGYWGRKFLCVLPTMRARCRCISLRASRSRMRIRSNSNKMSTCVRARALPAGDSTSRLTSVYRNALRSCSVAVRRAVYGGVAFPLRVRVSVR